MPRAKRLVVGLLSHYFQDDNLGCVALSICDVILMDRVAADLGIDLEYRILVNEKHEAKPLAFTKTPYEYRAFSSSKQTLRHPFRWWRSNLFSDCDVVVNINAGDGFTDIYGFARLLSESYMSKLAQLKGKAVIMAPQTIGPFSRHLSRLLGRNVLRGSTAVFSRDELSTQLCRDIGVDKNVVETIDVAFALPFEAVHHASDRPNVGLNVSGLLYRGGYSRDNYFHLAFDYKEFLHVLTGRLLSAKASVHLVSHVLAASDSIEDDFSAAQELHEAFPDTIVAPRFSGPIEAKGYIAGLDLFSGARMHSTIAAISSGVPVVPIGYSRKMPGLYNTLGYPYYVDACDPVWTPDSAAAQVMRWFDEVEVLRDAAERARQVFEPRLGAYTTALSGLFQERAAE